MGYFPFFMNITGKKGVIVGGGKVAARKVDKLLAFGPDLTVIAPRIEACIRVGEEPRPEGAAASLFFKERAFRPEDLAGADFVIAATDDEALNGRISDYCRANRIPVNVADDREKCTFFFPALVREGALTIGISTDGRSPAAASWVKGEISRRLPPGIGDVIDLMGQIRAYVMEADLEEADRKQVLESMFLYCMEKEGHVTLEELAEAFGVSGRGKQIHEQNPNWYKGQ